MLGVGYSLYPIGYVDVITHPWRKLTVILNFYFF